MASRPSHLDVQSSRRPVISRSSPSQAVGVAHLDRGSSRHLAVDYTGHSPRGRVAESGHPPSISHRSLPPSTISRGASRRDCAIPNPSTQKVARGASRRGCPGYPLPLRAPNAPPRVKRREILGKTPTLILAPFRPSQPKVRAGSSRSQVVTVPAGQLPRKRVPLNGYCPRLVTSLPVPDPFPIRLPVAGSSPFPSSTWLASPLFPIPLLVPRMVPGQARGEA